LKDLHLGAGFFYFFLGAPKKLQKNMSVSKFIKKKSGILLREKKSVPRCNLGIFTKDASHHPGGDNVLSCETWRVKKIAMFDICY